VDDSDLPSAALSGYPIAGLLAESSGQALDGRYRVRQRVMGERAVPQQLNAPRFGRLEEAERCARQQAERSERPQVVEKLAPAGCWLELFTVGSLLAT
jgi:hypothetical protein